MIVNDMTELENKLVEKILEKIDMDALTDKIAERAAEIIVQKEYPSSPATPSPSIPWTDPWWLPSTPDNPFAPVTVMYGVIPTQFEIKGGGTTSTTTTAIFNEEEEK